MRMHLLRHDPPTWSGKIGPCLFRIWRPASSLPWRLHARGPEEGADYYVAHYRKLPQAKKSAARWWLCDQFARMPRYFRPRVDEADLADLVALTLQAIQFRDGLAAFALRDWLLDHDAADLLCRWVLEPGSKAKVIWPCGWEEIAKAGVP